MKITNPDWHPAPSQLSIAQRRIAQRLLTSYILPLNGWERKTMASLVRHDLAKLKWQNTEMYEATDKLKDWKTRGLI